MPLDGSRSRIKGIGREALLLGEGSWSEPTD